MNWFIDIFCISNLYVIFDIFLYISTINGDEWQRNRLTEVKTYDNYGNFFLNGQKYVPVDIVMGKYILLVVASNLNRLDQSISL